MADSQSLQAFVNTVTVKWPEQQKQRGKEILIKAAKDGHGKIMQSQTARAGVPPDFIDYANTPGNTDLNSVTLPGPIVFKYKYLREICEVALDELRRASPVDSGEYVRSHTLFIDGAAVEVFPPGYPKFTEVMISNPVPYARKLEVGKTESGRAFVIQVEPHIYERVVDNVLKPRYGNVAKISFGFASLPDAYRLKFDQVSRRFKGGVGRISRRIKPDRAAGSAVTAPTIFIEDIF